MGWLSDFRCDLQRYVDDGLTPGRALLTQQGLWATLEYRLARVARDFPLMRPFFAAWQKCVEVVTGISIGHGATIGPGLWITRFGGIIVHDDAVIGRRCHLCQGATVGHGAPVIGDDVYVGPHAIVLGRVTVGDGARIGANSVVTRDVPGHSHVWPAPSIVAPAVDVPADRATAERAGP
jgi:serine O-acetyltransferase